MSSDNCCIDAEKAMLALSNVSGALVDSGVVVPAEEWKYGEAVREITKQRDAAREEVIDIASILEFKDADDPNPGEPIGNIEFRAVQRIIRERDALRAELQQCAATIVAYIEEATALRAKVAMYNDADQVSFGEDICVEGCTVWDYSSGSKERNGGRTFTVYPSHDAAVAKAFELSNAGGK